MLQGRILLLNKMVINSLFSIIKESMVIMMIELKDGKLNGTIALYKNDTIILSRIEIEGE